MKFLCYMNDAKIEACVIIKSWSLLVVPDSFNPHDLVCTRNDTGVGYRCAHPPITTASSKSRQCTIQGQLASSGSQDAADVDVTSKELTVVSKGRSVPCICAN